MTETMKIIVVALLLLALRLDDAYGFNGGPANPPELPSSSSPLRVASTAWATTNDGVGACGNEPSRRASSSSSSSPCLSGGSSIIL